MRPAVFPLFLAPLLLAQPAVAATLNVYTEASPEGFDMVQYNSLTTTSALAGVLVNCLVESNTDKGTVMPPLAERWPVPDDGLSYHFGLRQDVHLHNTVYFELSRILDTDDVVFSFRRMLDPANPWHKVTQNGFPHVQSMQLPELIERVEKNGDHQVLIVPDYPNATSLPMLSMGFASIYSTEYVDQLMKAGAPEKLNTAPIGSGSSVLKCFQKGAVVCYAASPEYFAGRPVVDALIFVTTPDANVRLQKLRRGECRIILPSKPLGMENARKDANLEVEQAPALMAAFVVPNTQYPSLDDPKVHRTINLVLDHASYLQTMFEGSASATTGIYPPNTWSYTRDIPAYPYDSEQTRRLLVGKRLPELSIWTRLFGSLLNLSPSLDAQLLQADLVETGIRASIRVIERGELIRRIKNGERDLLFMGWTDDNDDPDDSPTPQFSYASVRSGLNFTRCCDPGPDELVADGKTVNGQEQRTGLYHQVQKLIHEQTLWLPLAHPTAFVLTRQEVQGYQVNPFGRQDFSRVAVKR